MSSNTNTRVSLLHNNNMDELLVAAYWGLPFILFLFQAVFTLNSLHQIRYEELAESVRNVFWLDHGLVYDGTSSNLGWYSPLLAIYRVFGFTLFTAKFYRLLLSLISFFCLAALLRQLLGIKRAFIPLATIGLSPTLLYFSTLQAQFGIDLQFLPICLYVVLKINPQLFWPSLFAQVTLWVIAMFAWMSYPTFVLYLPVLVALYLKQLQPLFLQRQWGKLVSYCVLSLVAFVMPFLLLVVPLGNKQVALSDPVLGKGIFRGSGTITADLGHVASNVNHLLLDMFSRGESYYFELPAPDFSHIVPVITFLVIISLSINLFWKQKQFRFALILIFFVLVANFLLFSFSSDPSNLPGIRRNTGILAALYALFTLCWQFITKKSWLDRNTQLAVRISLLLLLVHHITVYPVNLSSLQNPSHFRVGAWYATASDPLESIQKLINRLTKEDIQLTCYNREGKPAYCRYPEIYATLAGSCRWNKLDCHDIQGFDSKTNSFIPLSVVLWDSYYWEH